VGLMWALPSLYRSAYSRRFARLAQIGARRVLEGAHSLNPRLRGGPERSLSLKRPDYGSSDDHRPGRLPAADPYRLGLGSVLSRTVREQPVLSQARMTTR
jgi:hypothetical protein